MIQFHPTRRTPFLKVALSLCGMRAWEVAREVGIDPGLLSRIANGREDGSPEVRQRLAYFFQTNVASLFRVVTPQEFGWND